MKTRVLNIHTAFSTIYWAIVSMLISISSVFGQTNPGGGGENPGGGGQNPGTGILLNPLKSATIEGFLMGILDILLTFAVPIIIFFIMYGGFKLVTARGDSEQISQGRAAITWAVIGGVIVLGARLIIGVIQGTVDAL